MRIQTLASSHLSYSRTSTALAVSAGQYSIPPILGSTVQSPPGPNLLNPELPDNGAGHEQSHLAAFALKAQLSELHYSSTETTFAYRRDNSLALRASSTTHLESRAEHYRFDLTLTAESLGLGPEHFVDRSKPLTIRFEFSQSRLNASYSRTVRKVQTLRPAPEIVQDLVRELGKVMGDPGNKTVRYKLDAEAIESLVMSDQETAALFNELIMTMAMINLMKIMDEESRDYLIRLSGKGQPYIDIQEESRGEASSLTCTFNLTILPPKEESEMELPQQTRSGDCEVQHSE